MLALVKDPPIEIAIQGAHAAELLDWIRQKYDVTVLTEEQDNTFVPIEKTEYWKEMEKNRIGNLLVGARLKAGLTQAQLAEKIGIRQNMISDYERGNRTYSEAMAKRLSETLAVSEEHLTYRSAPEK